MSSDELESTDGLSEVFTATGEHGIYRLANCEWSTEESSIQWVKMYELIEDWFIGETGSSDKLAFLHI